MIRSDGSLYISTDWTRIDPKTGRFMKGHEPKNKGKKWDEWASKKSQRKMQKGWKNLDKYRCKGHPNAGRKRKEVIAVRNNGTYCFFEYLLAAAEWIGGTRENVGRCCRQNGSRKPLKKPWGHDADKINTDHQYKGVRFYFADDPIWMEKIGKDIILWK